MGSTCKKQSHHDSTQLILIFSGPSGVGKGTLLSKLMCEYSDLLEMSVSWTTRKKRDGEREGVSYFFKTMEEFEQEEKKNGFIEVSNNYGNKYGTNQKVLKEINSKGKICVLEVDVEAGQKIHKILPNSKFIFFNVKNIESLKERMKKRGTEKNEEIEKRFEKGKKEIEQLKSLKYYKEIFNEDFDECYQEIIQLLESYYPEYFKRGNDD